MEARASEANHVHEAEENDQVVIGKTSDDDDRGMKLGS